jgi:hypothetical protein
MPEIRKNNSAIARRPESAPLSNAMDAEPEFSFAAQSPTPPKELLEASAQNQLELADDILIGAEAIRQYLGLKNRRQVYYLVGASRWVPVWRLSGKLCALKSGLRAWIAAQVRTGNPKGVPHISGSSDNSSEGGK